MNEIANFLEKGQNCLYHKKTEKIIEIPDKNYIEELNKYNCFEIIFFKKLNNNQLKNMIMDFINNSMEHPLDIEFRKVITEKKPIEDFKEYIKKSYKHQKKWNEFKNNKIIDYIIEKTYENEFDNTECLIEDMVECHNNEDWETLLKITQQDAENDPENLQKQEQYAIALNYNKKYEETIKLLEPYYRKAPDIKFGVELILEALYGLNKTENDFDWIKDPIILDLDKNTLKMCKEYLKGKRKSRSMNDIWMELYLKSDFLKFNKTELGEFLYNYPEIFEFSGSSSNFYDLKVKLKKKKK